MKSNLEWLHNSIFLSITFYDKTSAAGERMDQNQLELKVISAYLYSLTTVLSKAALLSCARFTCDIYANFSLIAK